jgi:RHH-type proline utilization regulon transcriptional repressor/proline dehydrogenase/delta 1-pyrroline-5-carboxylate dehydrogenase
VRWATANEPTKVQLFRFVDVIPMLHEPEAVADHFAAYFDRSQGLFPLPLRFLARLARTNARSLVGRIVAANARRTARRFVAGATLDEIQAAVRRFRKRRLAFTLDVLGEATIAESEADAYQREYLSLLERLGPECARWPEIPEIDRCGPRVVPRLNLSVKASALYSRFDPIAPEDSFRGVAGRLREIFRAARRCGAFVNLDMEQYAYKDLTLAIFRRLLCEPEFRDWPDAGLAVQAYLKDAERDLRELLDWARARGTPVSVRIVKGAYWDYETVVARLRRWPTPVFTEKWRSDVSFDRCAAFLLEHRAHLRPAIASHNLFSIAHALAAAESFGAAPGEYELQMLYGMGEPFFGPLVERGERVRVYAPYGKLLPGMAYLVRRLLENSSNTSFLNQTLRVGRERDALQEYLARAASTAEA